MNNAQLLRAFLSQLEYFEKQTMKAVEGGGPIILDIDKIGTFLRKFPCHQDERMLKMAAVYTAAADEVRRSAKFFANAAELEAVAETVEDMPFEPPFPMTTLVVQKEGDDGVLGMCMYCEQRTGDDTTSNPRPVMNGPNVGSDMSGVPDGVRFYCLTVFVCVESGGLRDQWLLPMECHILPDEFDMYLTAAYDLPPDICDTGQHALAGCANVFYNFIKALSVQDMDRVVSPGLKPGIAHKPRKFPKFEYTTLKLKVHPHHDGKPRRGVEGRRHRFHPVRSHWRHYATGQRVRIPAHYRGDPSLGVIAHDYKIQVADPDNVG